MIILWLGAALHRQQKKFTFILIPARTDLDSQQQQQQQQQRQRQQQSAAAAHYNLHCMYLVAWLIVIEMVLLRAASDL